MNQKFLVVLALWSGGALATLTKNPASLDTKRDSLKQLCKVFKAKKFSKKLKTLARSKLPTPEDPSSLPIDESLLEKECEQYITIHPAAHGWGV
ncbi:hypothetical protein IWQ60_006984 [Tieghemiomyces parasiticus]|uniref:Uncharacterized protein n=1 Tax=Tieghemiomyces parasiticus TaxID=78921 RepID=A0A9W8A9X6_9FUNG|nr:hypothetical protein IWQ60_006984 [Tieghemiomyces parasiticus]